MKKIINHALLVWVWALGVFSLLPSSVYAQEQKDSIHSKVHELDAVTVTARRMPSKITSTTAVQVFNKEDLKNLGLQNMGDAVKRFATVLQSNGIQTLNDIRSASPATISAIETGIKTIPGQSSGISFSYFLMLSGDDNHMKIDRWLLRFVGDAFGESNYLNVSQAYADLLIVCSELKKIYPDLTPRLLDHTIWSYMK